MTSLISTARRRELGSALRTARMECDISGTEMAHRLRWPLSKLSRVETGKLPIGRVEVAYYCGICGIAGDQFHELLALADERDDYRLKIAIDQIPDELSTLMFHESTATAIDMFEPLYIPGITQTRDYARAVFVQGGRFDGPGIESRVEIRMARQQVFTRWDPVRCMMYVHEYALRSMVGSPQVMLEQMLRLLFVSNEPLCSIRVVPASTGCRGLVNGSFHIFRYAEDSPLVYIAHEIAAGFLESKTTLAACEANMTRIASVALTEDASRDFIGSMAGEYERLGAAPYENGSGGSELA